MRSFLFHLVCFFLFSSGVAFAEEKYYTSVPEKIDPQGNYLFYLHGSWLEHKDLGQPNKRYGRYNYREIINELAQSGYFVISERRSTPVPSREYAGKVAQQVNELLSTGVPPEKVTVIGHSKGGQITLWASAFIKNASIHYVIMAGCGKAGGNYRKGYEKFLNSSARELSGKILSLYDEYDTEAQTCGEAFEKAYQAETREIKFSTKKGHGLFYYPDSIWMDEVKKWSFPK